MKVLERSRPRAPLTARLLLWAILGCLYLPLFTMLWGAWFEPMGDEKLLTLRWFREVYADTAIGEALARSLFVAFAASLLATAIGTAAAIGLERTRFRGKLFFRALSLGSLALPELLFALALLSWFVALRIELSLFTVVAAHVTFCLAYVILTVSSRLALIEPALADAARDLGASEWGIVRRIFLPLLAPGMLAAFLLCFLLSFDDFLITFYTTGPGLDTLPIKLYTTMRLGLSPKLNALASLMFAGSLCIIGLLWRLERAFRA